MAYVANTDEQDQAQNVATNIFSATTGGGQQAQGSGQAQALVPTAGGDQSTAIESGGNATNAGNKAPQSNSASSSKEVIRRNAGQVQSPVDIGSVRQNITKSGQDLQAEANNYVSGQASKNQALDDNTIGGALSGNTEGYSKVANRLNQAKPQYENFNPQTQTDYSSKLKELNDSSLRNYFKNAGGPSASQGDAAFDAMLLGKNNQFKQDRAQAQLEAQNLQNSAKSKVADTNTQAKSAYEQAYDAETARSKAEIGKRIDPIRQQAEAQAAAESAKRKELAGMSAQDLAASTFGVNNRTENYKNWLEDIANQVGGDGAEDTYLRATLGASSDPTKYSFINRNQGPVTASNYLNADQASMINRGQQLLGSGGTNYSAAGGVSPAYSFNADAAKTYMRGMLNTRQADMEKQAAVAAQAQAAKEAAAQEEIQRQQQADAAAQAKWNEQNAPGQNQTKGPKTPVVNKVVNKGTTEVKKKTKQVLGV